MPTNSDNQPTSEVSGEKFPAALRLRHASQFQNVYRIRKSVSNGTLIVYGAKNELGYPRLGLSVSRKVGNAVVRNRWKRWIREAFRRHRTQLPSSIDYIVIPRPTAEPTAASVASSFVELTQKVAKKLPSENH